MVFYIFLVKNKKNIFICFKKKFHLVSFFMEKMFQINNRKERIKKIKINLVHFKTVCKTNKD